MVATPDPGRTAMAVLAVALAAGLLVPQQAPAAPPPAPSAADDAPGAPGRPAVWTDGAKTGFGTARGVRSKVWYTLGRSGTAGELYYPRIDTPSVRESQFVVTDGETFTDREDADTRHRVRVLDERGLTYQMVNTDRGGDYRITKTFVTDPDRSTVLVDVRFESLSGDPYEVYLLHDPALDNDGTDDRGDTREGALVARQDGMASTVDSRPAFTATSSGYLGTSDGWTDLAGDHTMDWTYTAPDAGNVVQTGRTALTGLPGGRHLTLAVGFGATPRASSRVADASLRDGFAQVAAEYAFGWRRYLGSLDRPPASVQRWLREWRVSAMVLAASEDKTYRGGFVAAPGRPWAWAFELRDIPVYHAVWSRDQYQIATGLLAAGDDAAANRALDYLWDVQQRAGRVVPAEQPARRRAGLRQPADGRGRAPDRPRLAARALGRRRLGARPAVGRLPGRERPGVAAGALGEPRQLLARDHRRGDRRPGLRGRHRPRQRQAGTGPALRAHRRPVARRRRAADRDQDRPALARSLLPAGHGGRRRRRRHRHPGAGRRPAGRRAPHRRPELPRAGAAGRQACRRPDHPQQPVGRRPAAALLHPERAVLAAIHVRRLRRDPYRCALGALRRGVPADPRPGLAAAHRRARRVPAGPRARRPALPGRDGAVRAGQHRVHVRAGVGRSPADRRGVAVTPSARARSRPGRWPGRTRSSCGWPGRSRRATRSRRLRWSPAATTPSCAYADAAWPPTCCPSTSSRCCGAVPA